MKKYRVLHIISRIQKGGGAEKNTLMTIEGLLNNGYDVTLLVGNDSNVDYAEKSISCPIVKEPYLIRAINPFSDFMAFVKIYKFIKAGDFDIVHTHLAKAGVLGRLAAYLAGTPIIIHGLHGITFHKGLNFFSRNIYLFFEKIAGKFTDAFISVGEDLKKIYIEARIGNPKNYFVVYSGVDLNRFYNVDNLSKKEKNNLRTDFGLSEEDVVIGMIATLEYRKGHKYAIEVAKRLVVNNPNVKFIFVGDGNLKNDLMIDVKKNGLDKNIIFTGYLNEVERVFAVCDIILLTSLWEGLPQVLVQAVAASRPIISFDVEGVREIVVDGKNGIIVPIKNVDCLVDKIKYLISNPEKAILMGKEGRALIGDRWKIERMIEQTVSIYEKLIDSKKLFS